MNKVGTRREDETAMIIVVDCCRRYREFRFDELEEIQGILEAEEVNAGLQ